MINENDEKTEPRERPIMNYQFWYVLTLINFMFLSFLGMAIQTQIETHYSEWFENHQFVGNIIIILAISGWIFLIVKTSEYCFEKARSLEPARG